MLESDSKNSMIDWDSYLAIKFLHNEKMESSDKEILFGREIPKRAVTKDKRLQFPRSNRNQWGRDVLTHVKRTPNRIPKRLLHGKASTTKQSPYLKKEVVTRKRKHSKKSRIESKFMENLLEIMRSEMEGSIVIQCFLRKVLSSRCLHQLNQQKMHVVMIQKTV